MMEEDLDRWVVPKLMEHYDSKLNLLARKAYGDKNSETSPIAIKAFKEHAKSELRSAVNTFIFKKEHWKSNRSLNTYLLTCFNRLSDRLYWDQGIAKKKTVPVCPACRSLGNKEILIKESGLLRCKICSKESERLISSLDTPGDDIGLIQSRIKLHSSFALHSRKGRKCPECTRFIPSSLVKDGLMICPFQDCIFIGDSSRADNMTHPMGVSSSYMVSLNSVVKSNNNSLNETSIQNLLKADVLRPDSRIDMRMRYEYEYQVLSEVINDQVELINRINSQSTIVQKLLMYEAFKYMIQTYPEEMVSYLVHRKQVSEFPLQAKIFQEYVKLMEDYLPFTIEKNGNKIDIVSLTDPNLSLFSGISEFEAIVRDDGSIPNNTKEEYIGGRSFINYGPYFIGKVINIVDVNTGESIRKHIKDYSFQQVNMDSTVKPGQHVAVKHFRIPSHYEMHSLVFLQRIRKNVVDAIYFRIHKKKRGTNG